jgi:MFS family permease
MADKERKWQVRQTVARFMKTQPHATVAALMLGGFFIGASQNLMAPNLTGIAKSFGLDVASRDVVLGGWMSSAFFIVGAPMSLIFGILADRTTRTQLFFLMCAAAAAINFGTGMAFAVYQLLVLRACLGAVYGALNPVLFSMVGDMYAPSARSSMASYFSLAVGGGTAIGQMLAGVFSRFGWRLPYFVVAAGSVLACFALVSFAVEPQRGAADAAGPGSALRSGAPATTGSAQVAHAAGSDEAVSSAVKHRHAVSSASSSSSSGAGPGPSPNTLEKAGSASGSGASTAASSVPSERASVKDKSAAGAAGAGSGAADAAGSPAGAAGAGAASGGDAGTALTSPQTHSQQQLQHGERLGAREFLTLLRTSLLQLRVQMRRVLAVQSNVLVFAQALFGTIPWSVITVYLPDYLAQEQGFSVPGATLLVLLFGIGAVVGGVAGGLLGSRLYKRGPSLMPLVFGLTQAASALPMLWLINAQLLTYPEGDASKGGAAGHGEGGSVRWQVFPVAITAGLFASLTGPNLKAILMNVNVAQLRGAVFTFAYIFDSISKGLAPALISMAVARVGSRQAVFSVALLGWVASGLIIMCISRCVARDEAEAQAKAAAPRPAAEAD